MTLSSLAKTVAVLSLLTFAYPLFADKHRRHHSAHAHGAAELGIVAEGRNAKITFKAPGDDIYGFEHEAKSAEDKAKQQAGLDKLKNNILKYVKFDDALGCKVKDASVVAEADEAAAQGPKDPHHHEHVKKPAKKDAHSEVEGVFNITCNKDVAGSQVAVNFASDFPSLKKVSVQNLGVNIKK